MHTRPTWDNNISNKLVIVSLGIQKINYVSPLRQTP